MVGIMLSLLSVSVHQHGRGGGGGGGRTSVIAPRFAIPRVAIPLQRLMSPDTSFLASAMFTGQASVDGTT